MSFHRIVIASIFALTVGLAGCGGGQAGDNCGKDDECGSGLICTPIVVCGPETTECPGICAQTCETDADCPEGILCVAGIAEQKTCHESVVVP